jgi:hypothetical protein
MQGINFIEPLFHAAIEGRKTQERRVMKPQPSSMCHGSTDYSDRIVYDFEFIKPRYQQKHDKDFRCGLLGEGATSPSATANTERNKKLL